MPLSSLSTGFIGSAPAGWWHDDYMFWQSLCHTKHAFLNGIEVCWGNVQGNQAAHLLCIWPMLK